MATPFMQVGQIVGAFGLKGEVKVEPFTDYPEKRFVAGARFRLKGDWVEVDAVRFHKGRPMVKLAGVDDATAAEALQWEFLEAPEERPELDEDEFLVDDLIGLDVVLENGEKVGAIDEVLDYPAHQVLQVGEVMIPLVSQFVKDVDLESGVVTVSLIPGMRPGEEA